MKRIMKVARGCVVALVGTACGMVEAAGFSIESFNSTGQLTFNEISTATVYRVEWAPTPNGPWTNNWTALAAIQAAGSGSVTCSVPMCYRVVATVTNTTPAWLIGMVSIPAGTNSGTDPDFAANGYGLYDMAGNIMEWCNDLVYTDSCRFQGGSWGGNASWSRCGFSTFTSASGANGSYGFRAICR